MYHSQKKIAYIFRSLVDVNFIFAACFSTIKRSDFFSSSLVIFSERYNSVALAPPTVN